MKVNVSTSFHCDSFFLYHINKNLITLKQLINIKKNDTNRLKLLMKTLSIQPLIGFLISFLTYVKQIRLSPLDIQTLKTKQEANLHFLKISKKEKKSTDASCPPLNSCIRILWIECFKKKINKIHSSLVDLLDVRADGGG